MPTRMLREGIIDSEAVNSLTWEAEVFYRRLMSVVDDFGRFDGRPSILRGRLYAAKLDKVREADIPRWIAECEKAGLIALFTADGKPYILFHKLGPPRAKVSKWPAPPADLARPAQPEKAVPTSENGCIQPHTDANRRMQTRADVPYSISDSDSGSNADAGSTPLPPAGGEDGGRKGPRPADVCAEWNRYPGLIPATSSDPNRDRMIRSWAGDPQWVAHWRAVIAFVGRSPMHTGGGPSRWQADLGWLFEKNNFARLVERVQAPAPPAPPAPAPAEDRRAAAAARMEAFERRKQGG